MTKVSVIGIGSPYGSDQFGWQVIEYLKGEKKLPDNVTLHSINAAGVSLLADQKETEAAILVDAVEGGKPGTQLRLKADQLSTSPFALSNHQISVANALELGKALKTLPSHIILFGVETGDAELAYQPPAECIKVTAGRVFDEVMRISSIK